jgi:DNA-binding SARP family transcriptional activator
MLKTADAVLLIDGHILLSQDVVWADVFALECLIDKPISPQELPQIVERLLELYRAPLLSAEDDTALIAVGRDRLRSQVLRTAEDHAGRLAARGEWELLSSLCRRAIEKEPLAESLHRELIRALLARGQSDQAQLASRRCERILTQALASTRHLAPAPGRAQRG